MKVRFRSILLIVIAIAGIVLVAVLSARVHRDHLYQSGRQLCAQQSGHYILLQDWQEAITVFSELDDYKDSKQWLAYATQMQQRAQEQSLVEAEKQRLLTEANARAAEQQRIAAEQQRIFAEERRIVDSLRAQDQMMDSFGYHSNAYQTFLSLRQAHPDWSLEDCASIACQKIRVGMSRDQVRAAWGAPDDINRTVTEYGTSEQWVYGRRYVYLDDGIVDSWQD